MPWVVKLSDSTTTVDLADGTVTKLNVNGFHAPVGPSLMSFAGGNLSRHGADLVERSYGNREISVDFQIIGSAIGTVVGRIQAINDLLRKGEEFAKTGFGNQLQLLYGWNNASSTVAFNVLQGTLDLGRNLHSPYLSQGTLIRNAKLELTAEPFAMGAKESITNYVADPSFEIAGSALADWTEALNLGAGATGTTTRTTGTSNYGTAALQLTIAAETAGGAYTRRYQTITGLTGSFNLIISSWARLTGNDVRFDMTVETLNTGGTVLNSTAGTTTVTCTAFGQITITRTSTATMGTIIVYLSLARTGGTASGTAIIDGLYVGTGTAAPTAWI